MQLSVPFALDRAYYNMHIYRQLGGRLLIISFLVQPLASKQLLTTLQQGDQLPVTPRSRLPNYPSLDSPYRAAKTSQHSLRALRALHLPKVASQDASGPITLLTPTSRSQRAK